MFKRKKIITVIYISRGRLKAGNVSLGDVVTISDLNEGEWSPDILYEVLEDVVDTLNAKKARILLSDDLTHLVSFNVPSNLEEPHLTQVISERILDQIPEAIGDENWSYNELEVEGELKEIIAFAPRREAFHNIMQAAETAGIDIETLEPETIAKARHSDPMIGLALKKELNKDKLEVLKYRPTQEDDNEEKHLKGDIVSNVSNGKVGKLVKATVIVILPLILLVLLIFLGNYFYDSRNNSVSVPQPTINIISTPAPRPTSTPEPVVNLANYSIQLSNGSGVSGEASRIKGILQSVGFANVATKNADNYNYVVTEVSLKQNTPELLFRKIEEILNNYNVTKSGILTETSQFDVVIIIGRQK